MLWRGQSNEKQTGAIKMFFQQQIAGNFRLLLLTSLLLHAVICIIAISIFSVIPQNLQESPSVVMVDLAKPGKQKDQKKANSLNSPSAPYQAANNPSTLFSEPTKPEQIQPQPEHTGQEVKKQELPNTSQNLEKGSLVIDTKRINSQWSEHQSGAPSATKTTDSLKKKPEEMPFGSANGPAFIRQMKPVYPSLAKRRNREGMVVLRLSINESGQLKHIEVMEDPGHGFAEAAVEAVRSSQFTPAKDNGKPVSVRAILPIRFKLN